MKIPISEIFLSIQGEGRNIGLPSIFIRFWGCNLICNWCDSKYSWDSTIEKANMLELEDIIKQIKDFNCYHIIFTGGEPTLFQKQIKEIQENLGDDYTYELETNGSKEIIEKIRFNQINISPKLGNSGNKDYKLEILNGGYYNNYLGHLDFKFVAGTIPDLVDIDKLLKEYKDKWIDGIYIMPLGTTIESQNNKIVLDYCIKNGYKYCLRQHIVLFGDKKGV